MGSIRKGVSGFRYRPSSQPTSSPSLQVKFIKIAFVRCTDSVFLLLILKPTIHPAPPEPLFVNYVVLVTTLFTLSMVILPLVRIWLLHRSKRKARFAFFNPVKEGTSSTPRTFQTFFGALVPLEFSANITWLQLFRMRLISHHCHVAIYAAAFGALPISVLKSYLNLCIIISGYLIESVKKLINVEVIAPASKEEKKTSLYEHALVCVGKTVNILLVTTLFVQFLYEDYGACASHRSQSSCEASGQSYTLAYPLCHWTSQFNTSIRNSSHLNLVYVRGGKANHTVSVRSYGLESVLEDESACEATKPNAHFMSIITLIIYVLAATALLDKVLCLLAAHAACMPRIWKPRRTAVAHTARIAPAYAHSEDEKEDENGVVPFDVEMQHLPLPPPLKALQEDLCDELHISQSVKATILRGARLKYLRENVDYVSAEKELHILTSLWRNPEHPLRFNDWLPVKHVVVPSLRHPRRPHKDPGPSNKPNRMEFLRRRYKSVLFRLYDFSDPYTVMDLLLHSLANERSLVVDKLLRARVRADRVRNEILRVRANILSDKSIPEHVCERMLDEHLLKRFLCEWICGYKRKVVESVLFHTPQMHSARKKRRRLQVIGYFLLPLYYAAAVAYILSQAIFSIGSNYV